MEAVSKSAITLLLYLEAVEEGFHVRHRDRGFLQKSRAWVTAAKTLTLSMIVAGVVG